MGKSFVRFAALTAACLSVSPAVFADTFNGTSDNGTDQYGYYYAVGGGIPAIGQTRNGDNATGGTIRFITDDPVIWGRPASQLDQWQKDDWFPVTSSLALTLANGTSVVFDNNGIETDTVPAGYWDASQVPGSTTVGYSMSNNFDWIYAGYFRLDAATTFDQITGYFIVSADPDSPANFGGPGFNPDSPNIAFHANIFSEVANQLPANTGSFAGDVFTSDNTPGSFSWSDTGYDRITASSSSDIYRLSYTLNAPITLAAGDYYFSTDASIVPLPSAVAGSGVLFMLLAGKRRSRS